MRENIVIKKLGTGIQMKKKIAIIGSKGMPSRASGLEVYVQSLCEELIEDYDITVFCRKRYCSQLKKEHKGIRIVHVPSINTKHLDAITYSFVASLIVAFSNYDLVWYHALGPAITSFIVKISKKKIVSTIHGLDWKREKFGILSSWVLRQGEKQIARNADEIIVLNSSDAEYFEEKWQRRVTLIPNAIKSVVRREPQIISEKYNLQKKEYILFMSRLVPEKCPHILIEAFKKIETDKKLVIAGKGVHTNSYEDELYNLSKDDKRIIFTGHVEGILLEELYSNAFIYVLPSTIEGQSIGLLEAISYGLPCLVSDISENIETIGNYKRSYSFCTNSVDSLEHILKKIIYEELDTINSKKEIISHDNHSWSSTVEKTKECLNKCLL